MCTELVPRALALAVLSLAAACGNESGGGERDVRVEDAPPDTRDATVDTIETTIGEAPTITVTSPREGEVVPAGVVVLEAAVADPDSALASLEVTWESSLDGALGVARPTATGLARLTIDTLTIGAHEITATVRDEGGRSAAMTVAMIVNGAPAIPVVTLSPEAPTTADTLVATLAPLVDPNREPSALTVTWVWLADGVAQVGLDGPMVPPDRTSRGQVWQVRVTIDDGHGATATGDASVTIVNAAPLCVSATLAPAEATTTTTLTCTCAGREDVDGDAAMDRCTFYDRGEVLAEIVADEDGTCVLDPELTARGMDVACAFAPGDGEAVGPSAVTTTVTIANTLPTVDVPIVSPSSTPVGGTFTCSVVGWSDPDPADATPTVDFQWLRRTEGGDVPIDGATADTLVTTGLARGDQVVCRVTPKNEGALGQARTSAAVTVTNRPPTTPIVAVSALEGADGPVTCALVTPAGDDEPLTYTYRWSLNGGDEVAGAQTLDAAQVEHCDLVACRAIASDGEATTTSALASAQMVLGSDCDDADVCTTATCAEGGGCLQGANTSACDDGDPCTVGDVCAAKACTPGAPAAASTAAVSPAVAYETSTLSCEPDTAVASCAFTVGWTVNGNASGTASTLSGTAFDKGDAVACSLTPSGGGTGTTSSPITIRDAPPSISGVSVTPTSTAIGGTFTCSYAGWSDPDPADATATVDYQWLLRTAGGDVAISGATAATIATTGLARGDQVVCRVTPRSGTTLGTPKTSAAVTVLNRAPTTPVVTVSAPDGAAGTVTCTLTTPATDDEPLTYTYAWSVNGTPIAATGPTLEAGVVFDCDLVRCQATASDGQAQATSAVASKAFPNGPDCDDGDTCNGAETCAAAGGCQSQTISGLLLHYDFERRISDQSGAGRDATASQTPLWGDGITGDAIRFDGSYTLTVSNAGALSPTTSRARTVSFWANVSTVGQHMAIGQYDNSTEAMFFVSISITDGYVRATGNGTDVVDAPLPSPYTGWHHWAFVFASGSDAVRIYRDGALVKTGTLALNANVSALAFLVGGASTGATFAGLMDELRIHDRALTDGEVQALGCSAATAELRINELDYDQPLSDVGEFLEIYNAGSTTVDLSAYRVQLINGDTPTNPTLYAAFDLQGQLPPGGYLVIAREALTGIAPDAHVLRFEDLFSVPLGGGALQNGPNDAVRIVTKVGGHRVDALIYESSAGLDPAMRVYGEGVPSSVAELDSDDPNRSIGRCPDGADTNDNATDFDRITPPTPGSENACGAAANEPFHAAARYDDDVERLVTTVALEVARIAVAGAATGAQGASVALALCGRRAAAALPVGFTRAPAPDTIRTCFGPGSCP